MTPAWALGSHAPHHPQFTPGTQRHTQLTAPTHRPPPAREQVEEATQVPMDRQTCELQLGRPRKGARLSRGQEQGSGTCCPVDGPHARDAHERCRCTKPCGACAHAGLCTCCTQPPGVHTVPALTPAHASSNPPNACPNTHTPHVGIVRVCVLLLHPVNGWTDDRSVDT